MSSAAPPIASRSYWGCVSASLAAAGGRAGTALLVAVLAVGQAMLLFGRVLRTMPPVLAEIEGEGKPPVVILDREVTLPRKCRK